MPFRETSQNLVAGPQTPFAEFYVKFVKCRLRVRKRHLTPGFGGQMAFASPRKHFEELYVEIRNWRLRTRKRNLRDSMLKFANAVCGPANAF